MRTLVDHFCEIVDCRSHLAVAQFSERAGVDCIAAWLLINHSAALASRSVKRLSLVVNLEQHRRLTDAMDALQQLLLTIECCGETRLFLNDAYALIKSRWPTCAAGIAFAEYPEFGLDVLCVLASHDQFIREIHGQFDVVILSESASEQVERDLTRVLGTSTKSRYSGWDVDCGVWFSCSRTNAIRGKKIAVVGAGIAGALVANHLGHGGASVCLIDREAEPAMGTSGNWAGAFHPHLSVDDAPLSKLSRLGMSHTLSHLRRLTEKGLLRNGVDWQQSGHLQLFEEADCTRFQKALAHLREFGFGEEFAQLLGPGAVKGTTLGGILFRQGGWIKTPRWVKASIEDTPGLELRMNAVVHSIDALLDEFDFLVIASNHHSLELAPLPGSKNGVVKGQITRVQGSLDESWVLSGESYCIPQVDSESLILGATYERPVEHLNPTDMADIHNMNRFKKVFPRVHLGPILEHRCGVRCVWADRLPAIGPHPTMPRVWMATGFASRGLLWAAMAGWMINWSITHGAMPTALHRKIGPR